MPDWIQGEINHGHFGFAQNVIVNGEYNGCYNLVYMILAV